MKATKLIATFLFLLVTLSLSAQRVYYKGDYYTLVNSKIFHLGHNVYGKLTAGQRDTIYMIARELYDENGKLKEQYKNRRKRDRYKLPEGYWEQKEAETPEATNGKTSIDNGVIMLEKESPQEFSQMKEASTIMTVKVGSDKRKNKDESHRGKDTIHKEKIKKEKAAKNKRDKVSEAALEKQEKQEKEQQRAQQQRDKAERKQEKKSKKAEKEQKKKAKELKQKEKAIDKYEDAERKLKKTEKKYKKLKEKGELSPNDEIEWLEKIAKLKETVEKTRKKAKKA